MEEEFDEFKEALNDKSNIVHEAADTIYHILVHLRQLILSLKTS
jgi:phosphoribosyl-ATP pyrophosphohydrolase